MQTWKSIFNVDLMNDWMLYQAKNHKPRFLNYKFDEDLVLDLIEKDKAYRKELKEKEKVGKRAGRKSKRKSHKGIIKMGDIMSDKESTSKKYEHVPDRVSV